MRLRLWKHGPEPLDWRPDLKAIVESTYRYAQARHKYRDGVVDEAIRRATGLTDEMAIVDAVTQAFDAYHIPVTPIAEFGLTG